jgi:hypothetical protein
MVKQFGDALQAGALILDAVEVHHDFYGLQIQINHLVDLSGGYDLPLAYLIDSGGIVVFFRERHPALPAWRIFRRRALPVQLAA